MANYRKQLAKRFLKIIHSNAEIVDIGLYMFIIRHTDGKCETILYRAAEKYLQNKQIT